VLTTAARLQTCAWLSARLLATSQYASGRSCYRTSRHTFLVLLYNVQEYEKLLIRKRHYVLFLIPVFTVQSWYSLPSIILHSLTHGAEPFLRSCQLCSHSRTSQHFMEPEGSSQCSQEPSTGPYPEPDQSSPYYLILRSILILSIHLRLDLPSGLFPSGIPTNILYAFLFSPIRATCLAAKTGLSSRI
jgi:hypothetical protein